MDKSEKYIKMANNPDIQGLWKPAWGDFVNDGNGLTWALLSVRIEMGDLIWLPRQDQLQDMIGANTKENLLVYLVYIADYADEFGWSSQDDKGATTMEQLWLAFVMKKKFNKLWSDNKNAWIAID